MYSTYLWVYIYHISVDSIWEHLATSSSILQPSDDPRRQPQRLHLVVAQHPYLALGQPPTASLLDLLLHATFIYFDLDRHQGFGRQLRLSGRFLDNQLDGLEPASARGVITVADTHQPVAILLYQLLGPALPGLQR